jgi:hypothetical protein
MTVRPPIPIAIFSAPLAATVAGPLPPFFEVEVADVVVVVVGLVSGGILTTGVIVGNEVSMVGVKVGGTIPPSEEEEDEEGEEGEEEEEEPD